MSGGLGCSWKRLGPRHYGFELWARAEHRDGDGSASGNFRGPQATHNAGLPVALVEDAESRDGDVITSVHRAHDRVNGGVYNGGRVLMVCAQPAYELVDELCFVHLLPGSQLVGPAALGLRAYMCPPLHLLIAIISG